MKQSPIKVQLLRCFKSDARISMEVYAECLGAALDGIGVEVSHFRPVSKLENLAKNRIAMRFLRYVSYPNQVRRQTSSDIHIQHVTDHGYAHLYPNLSAQVKVCAAHDLIPLLTWKGRIEAQLAPDGSPLESTSKRRKPLLNLHSLKYLNRFDHLITISECSARDLEAELGIDRAKISVVPPVIGRQFVRRSQEEVSRVMAKYGLSPDRKWVMLSGSEYYKNHRNSLLSIAKLINRTHQKIGIFKAGWVTPEFKQMINELGLSSCTIATHVDGADLPALYSGIGCLSFPSLYEGFGMPVAEAAACGTPAVISNRGALSELDLGLFNSLDPFDTDGISNAIEVALFDQKFRGQVYEIGPEAVAPFREEQVGRDCYAIYCQLLNRNH